MLQTGLLRLYKILHENLMVGAAGGRDDTASSRPCVVMNEKPLSSSSSNHSLSAIDIFWEARLRAQIGRDLRSIYEEAFKEPLPPHLAVLLARLEQIEQADRSLRR